MSLRRLQLIYLVPVLLMLMISAATQITTAQITTDDQPVVSPPVSYASVNQLNGMLTQLEQASQATQVDLAKLRIERWKTDSGTKRQVQSNVDSIDRNLKAALPEIIGQLRGSPENVAVTFKLYRNLSALYDVFSSVVESAGAFGSKDEFQSLANDLSAFDQSRRSLGDRTEGLAGAKEAEITHLRTDLHQAQVTISSNPPKKVVVDDTEAPKKPKKKIPAATPKTPTKPSAAPAATKPTPAASAQKPQ
jgi:hypothetical protein